MLTAQAVALVGHRSAATAVFVTVVALAVPGSWLSRSVGTDLSALTVVVAVYALCVGRWLRDVAPVLGGGALLLVAARAAFEARPAATAVERFLLPVAQIAVLAGLPRVGTAARHRRRPGRPAPGTRFTVVAVYRVRHDRCRG